MSFHAASIYRNDYCFAGVIGNISLELGLLGPALYAFPGTLLQFKWEQDKELFSCLSDAEYFSILKKRGIEVKEYFGHDLRSDVNMLDHYFKKAAARGHSLPVCLNSSQLFYHFSYGSKVWQFPHMVLLRKFNPAHALVEILDSDLNAGYSGPMPWLEFMAGRRDYEREDASDWILDVEFSQDLIRSRRTVEDRRNSLKSLIVESDPEAHNHNFREFTQHLESLKPSRSELKRLLIDFNHWLIKKDQERHSLIGILQEIQTLLPNPGIDAALRENKIIVAKWKSLRKKTTLMRDDFLSSSTFTATVTRNLADICQAEGRLGSWLRMLAREL